MSEAVAAPFSRLLSDERLTRRAVGGDERAFAAIFSRYHQSLYRFCLAIVGNPDDASEALQNTMIKVLRALPGEERKIELKPWLYRIAHNESIDLLRRRREMRELDVEQVAPGYGLAEDAATRERLRRLLTDLKELPERQREVLVMRELAGLEFEQIGSALDTSGAVARQTLYEARQSLRQMELQYLQDNAREYEITSSFSLAQLDKLALEQLRRGGDAFFSLPEAAFDLRYPGHYFRRIKSVALTLPCVAGPYVNVGATLTLLRSSVRSSPLLNAQAKYARAGANDARFRDVVGQAQSIVTSAAVNDSGVFDSADDRYLH